MGEPDHTRMTADVSPERAEGDPEVGERIGAYRLLERLGEGGFGAVYAAEQLEPVRRRVALKIIKLGMDTRAVVARFEAERQALAMMDHPGIARVYDAGATPEGRPYFAMELVRGEPITVYCDRHGLGTRERLELMGEVCAAIQHAHQKGIIHRDLKPSNVLVSEHGGKGLPKVIDFGIAKATTPTLTEKTVYTRVDQLIGTPEYMSPEQADPSAQDVDTRTDVYSLGVMLYELLTGVLPYDHTSIRKATPEEIRRVITEQDPAKPSTRVRSPSGSATRGATGTGTGTGSADAPTTGTGAGIRTRGVRGDLDTRSLSRQLKGDLDWIALKSLEKDRSRRYATPSDLAQDIQRYLENRPVSAGPPGTAYRVRKFARRNRGLLAGAGVVLVGAVAGVAGLGYGFVEASREAERAKAAEVRERDMRLESERQRTLVEEALGTISSQLEQVTITETTSGESDTGEMPSGGDVEALADTAMLMLDGLVEARREAQDQAVEASRQADRAQAANRFLLDLIRVLNGGGEEQLTVADALDAISRVHIGMSFSGMTDALTSASIRLSLASAYDVVGETAPAIANAQSAYSTYKQVLGEAHPETIRAGRELGRMLTDDGRLDDAEPLLRIAAEGATDRFDKDPDDALETIWRYGELLDKQGRVAEADTVLRRGWTLAGERLGPGDVRSVAAARALFELYIQRERGAEIRAELAALAGRLADVPSFAPDSIDNYRRVALQCQNIGLYEQAADLYEKLLGSVYMLPNPNSASSMHATYQLGVCRRQLGEHEQAKEMFRRVSSRRGGDLGPGHWVRVSAQSSLADLIVDDDPDEALALMTDLRRHFDGAENLAPITRALAFRALGAAQLRTGDRAGAREPLSRAVGLCPTDNRGPDWVGAMCRAELALALDDTGEAETLLLEAYTELVSDPDHRPRRASRVAGYLADFYADRGEQAKSERWRERAELP